MRYKTLYVLDGFLNCKKSAKVKFPTHEVLALQLVRRCKKHDIRKMVIHNECQQNVNIVGFEMDIGVDEQVVAAACIFHNFVRCLVKRKGVARPSKSLTKFFSRIYYVVPYMWEFKNYWHKLYKCVISNVYMKQPEKKAKLNNPYQLFISQYTYIACRKLAIFS